VGRLALRCSSTNLNNRSRNIRKAQVRSCSDSSQRFSRVRRDEEGRSEDSGSASFESSNRAQGPASAVPGRDRLAQTHSSSTGSSTQKISTSTEGEREGGMEGWRDGGR